MVVLAGCAVTACECLHVHATCPLGVSHSSCCALLFANMFVMLHGYQQVWKDVDGVLSSDPRIVPSAQPVNELTYEEATELAFFGAQVGFRAQSRKQGIQVGAAGFDASKRPACVLNVHQADGLWTCYLPHNHLPDCCCTYTHLHTYTNRCCTRWPCSPPSALSTWTCASRTATTARQRALASARSAT